MVSILKKRYWLLFLLFIFLALQTSAQIPNYFLSGDFSSPNSWTQANAAGMTAVASPATTTYLYNTTAKNPTGANKPKGFRFYSALTGGTIYGPNGADVPVILASVNNLNATGNASDVYTVTAQNNTNRIIFKTDSTARLMLFEIQGAVSTISSVTRNPAATVNNGQDVVVTAALSAALPTGQYAYLRYTINGDYTSSTILPMTLAAGTNYQATIPAAANTTGTAISFYVFTSGLGSGVTNANADLSTINASNSSSYTVGVTITWTTAAPGNWSNPATWTANAVPPTSGSLGTVTINHKVTLDQNATASALNINADTLTTQGANTLTVTGATTIAAAAGLVNSSTIATNFSTSSLVVNNGGTYIHNAASSVANGVSTDFPGTTRTFGASSNVIIKKWANGGTTPVALPTSGNPGWGNLTIDVASLGGNWVQAGNLTRIQGDFTVNATSSYYFGLLNNTSGTLTIGGKTNLSGGSFLILSNGSGKAAYVTMNGDLTLSNNAKFQITTGGFNIFSVSEIYIYLKGDLLITNTAQILQPTTLGLVTVIDFSKTSGTQYFTSHATGINNNCYVGWGIGDITKAGAYSNTLELKTDFIASTLAVFRIFNKATLRVPGEITVTGVGAALTLDGEPGGFTLYSGGILEIGSANGIAPANTYTGNIQSAGARNYNAGAHYKYIGAYNQVTGTGLPTNISGSLTVANTGINPADIVLLTTNFTSTSTFNLEAGRFQAGNAKTLRISSGGIVNGAGYNSYTGNQYILDDAGGTIEFVGTGTVNAVPELYNITTNGAVNFVNNARINHYFTINTGGSVNTNPPKYAIGSTLIYNPGGTYTRGKEWDQVTALDPGYPHHVLIQNSSTVNMGTTTPTRLAIGGDLTIGTATSSTNIADMNALAIPLEINGNLIIGNISSTANELKLSTAALGDLHLYGNFTRYTNSNLYTDHGARAINFKGTGNSTVSTPLASGQTFSYAVADKSTGSETITLITPVGISENMTFTKGIVNTDATNLLTISNTNTNAVAGGSILSFVNGPMKRFTSSITTGAYAYPLGAMLSPNRYKPITLTTINNIDSGSDFTGQYFYANPPQAGSDAFLSNLVGIQNNEYWQLDRNMGITTGTVTIPYSDPGAGNWRDAVGVNINPCGGCEVGVVKRAANSGNATWDFTAPTNTLSNTGTPPELMISTGSGDLISQEVTSFSPFTAGFYYDVILPVRLVSFKGKLVGNDALITWELANGAELQQAILEHSTDGRKFNQVQTFTSILSLNYKYTDKGLSSGAHFYRLAILDKSGQLTYSPLVLLTVGKHSTQIIGLLRNPVEDHLGVEVLSANPQSLHYTITDVLGRKFASNSFSLAEGFNQHNLDVHQLPPGNYFFVSNTSDGVTKTIQFVKQ